MIIRLVNGTPLGTQISVMTDRGTLGGAASNAAGGLTFNASSDSIPLAITSSIVPGTATVTVKTSSSFATDTITFTPAKPSLIRLTSNVTSAKANGQDAVALVAHLFREVGQGTVSQGTRVAFDVYRRDSLQTQMGAIALSDTAGVATHSITTMIPGTYLVKATSGGQVDSLFVTFTTP